MRSSAGSPRARCPTPEPPLFLGAVGSGRTSSRVPGTPAPRTSPTGARRFWAHLVPGAPRPGFREHLRPAETMSPEPEGQRRRSARARSTRRWSSTPRWTSSSCGRPERTASVNSRAIVSIAARSSAERAPCVERGRVVHDAAAPPVQLDHHPARVDRRRRGQGELARHAALVAAGDGDDPEVVAVCVEVRHRPEHRFGGVEHVWPEVEQRAVLEPPRRPEVRAGQRAVPEHRHAAAVHGFALLDEEAAHRRDVPVGEEQLRRHPRSDDRRREALRLREVEPDRLVEQQRPTRPRRVRAEVRLHVGRHRERHRVAPGEQLVEVGRPRWCRRRPRAPPQRPGVAPRCR